MLAAGQGPPYSFLCHAVRSLSEPLFTRWWQQLWLVTLGVEECSQLFRRYKLLKLWLFSPQKIRLDGNIIFQPNQLLKLSSYTSSSMTWEIADIINISVIFDVMALDLMAWLPGRCFMQHMCAVSCKQQDCTGQLSFGRAEQPKHSSHALTVLNFMGGFHHGHLWCISYKKSVLKKTLKDALSYFCKDSERARQSGACILWSHQKRTPFSLCKCRWLYFQKDFFLS